MQKILIVTDCYEPSINGVVTTLKNLKKEAERDGYQVLMVEPSMFMSLDNPFYSDVPITLPFGFSKVVDDFAPDFIHVATEGPLGIAALRYCARRGYNFTTAFHTKWGEFLNSMFGIPVQWVNSYLARFHRNKIVFCTSKSMVEYLKDNFIGRVHISWSRGVDADVFGPPRLERKDNKFISQRNLVTVNRISKEKNIDDFCRLSTFLYTLTVVGDGPYLNELKAKYPKVRFTGALTGKALANAYADADVFVFPSRNDTFGVVNIEAQMMGTPVAAYPVTGPRDIIVEGINGSTDDDLNAAVKKALTVDRRVCYNYTFNNYSWKSVWETFKDNMVGVKKNEWEPSNYGNEEERNEGASGPQ